MLGPGYRVGATKDLKMGFCFLVDSFHFTISLGMIGGGESKFISEEFPSFFSKCGGELWSAIRDDFIVETESLEHFGEE